MMKLNSCSNSAKRNCKKCPWVIKLSNKEHCSIAKVSLCPFVPADVSEVMINYKSKRKEVSDAGKQSKQFKTESNIQEHEASIQTITNLSSPSVTGSA